MPPRRRSYPPGRCHRPEPARGCVRPEGPWPQRLRREHRALRPRRRGQPSATVRPGACRRSACGSGRHRWPVPGRMCCPEGPPGLPRRDRPEAPGAGRRQGTRFCPRRGAGSPLAEDREPTAPGRPPGLVRAAPAPEWPRGRRSAPGRSPGPNPGRRRPWAEESEHRPAGTNASRAPGSRRRIRPAGRLPIRPRALRRVRATGRRERAGPSCRDHRAVGAADGARHEEMAPLRRARRSASATTMRSSSPRCMDSFSL